MRMTVYTLAAAAVVLLGGGCGGGPVESAHDFASLASAGYDVDYDPMGPPVEAIQESDLIVRGTLVEVFDGLTVVYPDEATNERHRGAYATFEATVAEVLFGDASLVTDGTVYMQVLKSPEASVRELADANPQPSVLLILSDITDWNPQPDATVTAPDRIPAGAPVLFANPDGLWLQTSNDAEMAAIHTELDLLDPAWGRPQNLDELAQVVDRCKDGSCS